MLLETRNIGPSQEVRGLTANSKLDTATQTLPQEEPERHRKRARCSNRARTSSESGRERRSHHQRSWPRSQEAPKTFTLYVRGAGRSRELRSTPINVFPQETVASILRQLYERGLSGRPEDTYLLYGGRKLQEQTTVAEYGIRRHDTVELRHRLRGGSEGEEAGWLQGSRTSRLRQEGGS